MEFKRRDTILHELKEHLPFTLGASLFASALVAVLYLTNYEYFSGALGGFFEIIHPAHVFVSAIATAAIYWRYTKSSGKTILVGITGAIIVGSLSDVFFPWLTGVLFSLDTVFHLPLIENPLLILGVATAGALTGMHYKAFRSSHILHVFLSVFASLFYLLAFSVEMSILSIFVAAIAVFLAVYIPCCISDIVFPIFFVKKPCESCGHWHD